MILTDLQSLSLLIIAFYKDKVKIIALLSEEKWKYAFKDHLLRKSRIWDR